MATDEVEVCFIFRLLTFEVEVCLIFRQKLCGMAEEDSQSWGGGRAGLHLVVEGSPSRA